MSIRRPALGPFILQIPALRSRALLRCVPIADVLSRMTDGQPPPSKPPGPPDRPREPQERTGKQSPPGEAGSSLAGRSDAITTATGTLAPITQQASGSVGARVGITGGTGVVVSTPADMPQAPRPRTD